MIAGALVANKQHISESVDITHAGLSPSVKNDAAQVVGTLTASGESAGMAVLTTRSALIAETT